jgi:hypothetical protein
MRGSDIFYTSNGTVKEYQAVPKKQPLSERPWGPSKPNPSKRSLSKQRKWLVLQVPAAEDAVVTAEELAAAKEVVAEGLVPPFQGKHLK